MKFWQFYITTVFLVSFCLVLLLWIGLPVFARDEEVSFESPLPEFLTIPKNNQVRLIDFWSPIIEYVQGAKTSSLAPSSQSVLMYDIVQDKTVFERNSTKRLPMASLTKIMTAIVALENPLLGDRYIVRREHLVGENSMGLTSGEILSLEELMYGLILPSGNDAAEVLAGNFPGGRTAFINAMNKKAQALGLIDTQFSNPSGLQGDGLQYSTAHDLLVITKYGLDKFPLFKKVVSTYEYEIPATSTHKYFYLLNETNLISSYPGVKGVKTGFTPEAGLCLVTYLEYNDHEIVGVMLNSQNRREEMKELLDYSLTELGSNPPKHT